MSDATHTHMRGNVPRWAIKRAARLSDDEQPQFLWDDSDTFASLLAFARYIAQHEEAPSNELADALNGLVPDVPDPLEGESHAEAFSRELTKELEARGLKIVRAEQ